ncbi:MAG: outer membrane protein assembly factor BamC, partial [Burkholderiales bacterium]|nr:outer membrane protein assembly factor BamC [Burkholderiales bacterium]
YTIESRDRIKGVYEVRLPGAGKEAPKPGFWARLFGKKADTTPIKPQRILVRASGTQTTINVVDDRDQTQDDAAAKHIAKDLFSELS